MNSDFNAKTAPHSFVKERVETIFFDFTYLQGILMIFICDGKILIHFRIHVKLFVQTTHFLTISEKQE